MGEQPASQKERAPQQSVGAIRGRNLPSCSSASTVGERARWTGGEGRAGNRGDFSRLCAHADPGLAEGWQRTSASGGFEAAQQRGFLSSFSTHFARPMLPLSAVVPPSRNTSRRHPSLRCCMTSCQRRHPCQGRKTLDSSSCPCLC